MAEAPLAFLEEQVEAPPRDAVVASQMALRLISEVPDPVDMVVVLRKGVGMFDAHVAEFGDVESVVSFEGVYVEVLSGVMR